MSAVSLTQRLLEEFPEGLLGERISLVQDSAGLISEEALLQELTRRDYLLHEFSETFLLREFYENHVRNCPQKRLVVLFRQGEDLEAVVPHDLRRQARHLDLSVEKLWPGFDATTLQSLERPQLQALQEKFYLAGYKYYNREATCEFLLEKVYGLSASAVSDNTAFLEALCRVHFELALRSPVLLGYLKDEICQREEFPAYQYESMILAAERFLAFVQSEWDLWISILKEHGDVEVKPGLKGYPILDFKQDRVRVQIDRLVKGGYLHGDGSLATLEVQVAYLAHGRKPKAEEALEPFFLEEETKLSRLVDYRDWLSFAQEWASFESLALPQGAVSSRLETLRTKVNARFYDWLISHYADLATLPGKTAPVMVHRTWQVLAKLIAEGKKVALLVVDGLALNQWAVLRRALRKDFTLLEGASFAWLPTLTSVSRQAIFSGKQPFAFASTLQHTNGEKKAWSQLWSEAGLGLEAKHIFYDRNWGVKKLSAAEELEQLPLPTKVCGLVLNRVDEMMHGETLGAANFQQQVAAWGEAGYLKQLVGGLHGRGFEVFLTSDHGNLGCVGRGKLTEGVLVETKGERARIYENVFLRDAALAKVPHAKAWPQVGLPSDFCPLFLEGSRAFATENTAVVAHGGPSIEEVVVPFVRFGRKELSL